MHGSDSKQSEAGFSVFAVPLQLFEMHRRKRGLSGAGSLYTLLALPTGAGAFVMVYQLRLHYIKPCISHSVDDRFGL